MRKMCCSYPSRGCPTHIGKSPVWGITRSEAQVIRDYQESLRTPDPPADMVRTCLRCHREFKPRGADRRPSKFVRFCPLCQRLNYADSLGALSEHTVTLGQQV